MSVHREGVEPNSVDGPDHHDHIEFFIYDKTKIVKVFILKLLSNVTVYSLIYDVIFSNFKFCSLLH